MDVKEMDACMEQLTMKRLGFEKQFHSSNTGTHSFWKVNVS